LRDSVASDIADQLDKVSAYLDAPVLTKVQKVAVIDFLISEFKTVQVDELSTAVKLVLAEKLETTRDIAYITKQSVGWWGTILSAWTKHKREMRKRPDPIDLTKPQLTQYTGVDGKDREYYEQLVKWYKLNGMPDYGWAYNKARKYAENNGLLLVKPSDKDAVWEVAREYFRTKRRERNEKIGQPHLDYAVMFLHLKRLPKNK